MTTTTSQTPLDRVGAALVEAHDMLTSNKHSRAAQDALVALCRASYDALMDWEVAPPALEEVSLDEPTSWRTPLDELRVQAALAEMELRDTDLPGVAQADELVRGVSTRITEARQEVGDALASLRGALRGALR